MRSLTAIVTCAAMLTASAHVTPAKAGEAGASGNVCLQTQRIDHTAIQDDSTILFTMNDRTVWKNSLLYPCTGLKIVGGFEYVTTTGEICSNTQSIRVLRDPTICQLGAFTPFAFPKKSE